MIKSTRFKVGAAAMSNDIPDWFWRFLITCVLCSIIASSVSYVLR